MTHQDDARRFLEGLQLYVEMAREHLSLYRRQIDNLTVGMNEWGSGNDDVISINLELASISESLDRHETRLTKVWDNLESLWRNV